MRKSVVQESDQYRRSLERWENEGGAPVIEEKATEISKQKLKKEKQKKRRQKLRRKRKNA